MRNCKIFILLILFSSLVYSDNFWMQTNGPTGGTCYSIVFAPNGDIYSVGGYDFVYRSTNDGQYWTKTDFINTAYFRYKCYSLIAAPNGNIFAGGGDNIYPGHHDPKEGIFKSTSNGSNWIKVVDAGYSKIVDFSSTSTGYLFAARDADVEHHSPGGMYISSDNGNTWTLYLIPPYMIAEEGIKCIASDNSGNVYAGTTTSNYGYYYSSNYGATWNNRRDFYFTDIVVNNINSHVFAVNDDGKVYRSVNAGLNWVNVSGSYFADAVSIWENENGKIFTKTSGGIYYSNDDGQTWVSLNCPSGIGVNTVSGRTNGNIYLGTDYDFIQKTTNNGQSWIQLADGTINSDVAAIAVNKNGIVYAARSAGKIYSSADNGSTWSLIQNSIDSVHSIAVDTLNYIYACRKMNVYRSTNSGASWEILDGGLRLIKYKFVYAGNDGNIYACSETNLGIYRTTNHGVTWTQIGLNYSATSMAVTRTGTIYVYYPNTGLYKSTNAGSSWNLITLNYGTIYNVNVNSAGYIYLCTSQNGVVRSINGGASWLQVNNGIDHSPQQIVVNSTDVLFAASTSANEKTYFYRSYTNGNNWESMNNGWNDNQYSATLYAGKDGILYSAAYINYYNQSSIGVWRSFASTNTHSISGVVTYADNNQAVSKGIVKAVRLFGGSVVTVDSARILSDGSYILPHVPVDSTDLMAFQDDEEMADHFYFVPTYYPSTIFWEEAVTVYPDSNLTDIDIRVFRMGNPGGGQNHIAGGVYTTLQVDFAGLQDAIVYAKLGNDFKGYSISKQGGFYQIDSLSTGTYNVICDRMGFGTLYRQVLIDNFNQDTINFYYPHGLIGITHNETITPDKFYLSQNYPNPFNPATVFQFGLPKTSRVKLVIYDILGREVKTLVDDVLHTGVHKVTWNASSLSSGVYFYRMVTDEYSETKRMVLLK
jgi:photosystem II stability/assembly factor-like uncharacterized protein